MPRIRTSRRAPTLKDSDYDHEISLVDHDAESTVSPRPLSGTDENDFARRHSTRSELLSPTATPAPSSSNQPIDRSESREQNVTTVRENGHGGGESSELRPEASNVTGPSIEVEQPTPFDDLVQEPTAVPSSPGHEASRTSTKNHRRSRSEPRESAIDILFENERGGFLCGIALFSGKALGNLDPPPWTNAYRKASPTNIHTAQVPDPSWEWAWPEWRINKDEGVDEGGWVYSFMFSRKFRWHGPRWYNSFVRRRTWIRKRIKKKPEDISADPHMLNADYFTIRPASEVRSRSPSRLGSHSAKGSISAASGLTADDIGELLKGEIEDMDTLLRVLRRSRIDREKIEAVTNYLANASAGELAHLQDEMHEIMGLFVFQASRRTLLAKLMQVYDEANSTLEKGTGKSPKSSTAASSKDTAGTSTNAEGSEDHEVDELRLRRDHLCAAIEHADEEVRRLSYWSDVKGMAERGESRGAVDGTKGWNAGEWPGIDRSGPAHAEAEHIPKGKSTEG